MKRRQFLTALPAAGGALIASSRSLPAVPVDDELHSPMPRDRPFLHVMDHEVFLPPRRLQVQPGYVLAVTPGIGPWDDLHLLRDGSLAAVAVAFRNESIHVHCYETGQRDHIPRDRANDLIAGRVVRIIRQDRGAWID